MTTVELVTVTPDIAREWLRGSGCPVLRRGSRLRIEALARAMMSTEWDAERSVITLSGRSLVDGHHRCKAAVLYGLTFRSTVKRR